MNNFIVSIVSICAIYSGAAQANIGGICCPFSDSSMKNSISSLTYSEASQVLKLDSKKYTWKEDGSKDIGFIAQDVEKLFPELVHEREGKKTVDYDKLIAPILTIIKQQQAQIDILEDRINKNKH
ncbi:hypothetical protein BCT63_20790 [Vibrio kanaloae]|uniref:Tail fiber domain-containing protein n=1 Tax=Vibrio kanaloae TaxID=170673 RepID=A0A4U1Z2K0_9VIBR|nr:tail fiber domain-containing protein [Vibrio kanaloae]PMM09651.1 hypothetical protein BCT63_20790 [Vibrio kanaloae]TKF26651.1 tail fiber domain-containing protein [Vibrio kanaloae]